MLLDIFTTTNPIYSTSPISSTFHGTSNTCRKVILWMLHGYSTIFVNFDGKRDSHDQTDADDLHDYLFTMRVSAVYSQSKLTTLRLGLC